MALVAREAEEAENPEKFERALINNIYVIAEQLGQPIEYVLDMPYARSKQIEKLLKERMENQKGDTETENPKQETMFGK